jgi:quercetin dioxygenase-like cupin family protein
MPQGQITETHLCAAATFDPHPAQTENENYAMSTDVQPTNANYAVKNVETVVASRDVQARIFTLAVGEVIPWHFHSETTDHYFVLSGTLTVETRAPGGERTLGVGERYHLAPGNAHAVSNHGATDCRFLLLQGVGRYDWIKA